MPEHGDTTRPAVNAAAPNRPAEIALFNEISSTAISSLDAEHIAARVADAAHAHFSTRFIALRLANRERSRLRIVALRGVSDAYLADAGILSVDAEHLVCEVFRTGAPAYGGGLENHPLGATLGQDLAAHGVVPGSFLVLPLKGRASTVGVLTLGWTEARTFSDHDVESFSSLANILAAGVENAYLYEDERGAAEVARRLSAASQKLATEFSGIFEALTDAVLVLGPSEKVVRANASATALFGLDPAGHELSHLVANAGIRRCDGEEVDPHEAPCRAALRGETVCDVPLTIDFEGTKKRVLVSAAPIMDDGVVTAAVSVWRDITEREALMESLAQERTRTQRLLADYRLELARTALLKDIAATAGSSLSAEQICGLVIDTVRSHLDPCQSMLHLCNDSGDALVLSSHFGLPAATASTVGTMPLDDSSPSGRVLVSGAAFVTHETPQLQWPDEQRDGSVRWIVVPIVSAGRPLGTLGAAFDGVRPFDQEEVSLFRSIAGQVAAALDNARLYQREHRIADTLQRSLLAESVRIHGIEAGRVYRSATEHVRVGGDFYDLYPLPDGRTGFTIGDVSGKGLRAASVTALVRNTLRAYALDDLEPHEVMRRANEVLCYFSDREVFATATYGILDPVGGAVHYCNGGHPSPMILRTNGDVAELDDPGAMLGAMEGLGYRTGRERLDPGDVLVLYTDGVTEARCGSEFYGEERLAALLGSLAGASAEKIAREVADAASRFGGGVLRDDVAVVALRLTNTYLT